MAWDWDGYGGYGGYVSADQKRRRAAAAARKLEKGGRKLAPVAVEGNSIAKTFWGKSWCKNLESYSDYASRLPRGRSYVRNGSVLDLQIQKQVVRAVVAGTETYNVEIKIDALNKNDWTKLKQECAGKVGSLIDLLRGRLSGPVMEIITSKERGLFPKPREIHFHCSCPDPALMCKHVAAALYGMGVRLDQSPELLFTLRGVDHLELITETTQSLTAGLTSDAGAAGSLDEDSLSDIFGIEMAVSTEEVPKPKASKPQPQPRVPTRKKTKEPAVAVVTSKPQPVGKKRTNPRQAKKPPKRAAK